jgi:plastin-1
VRPLFSRSGITTKKKKSVFQVTENNNVVVESAAAIGVSVVNIGANDLMEGKKHLILGVIWQILKIGLMAGISLKDNPNLARLLEEGEDIRDLLKLSPEELLLRWFNYHLKNAGTDRRVANLGPDIKVRHVFPTHCIQTRRASL